MIDSQHQVTLVEGYDQKKSANSAAHFAAQIATL